MSKPNDPRIPLTDLEAYGRGENVLAHRFLGAHPVGGNPGSGTRFAVWAPNATEVGIMGGFNGWDGRRHLMEPRGDTGIWELVVPEAGPGELYKYVIQGYSGQKGEKADPFGFSMEVRPQTASRIWTLDNHRWGDRAWLDRRQERQGVDQPFSVYEVHLGSWRHHAGRSSSGVPDDPGWLSYRELAETLVPYVRDLGFTHIELLPVTEHPYDKSWGYQTAGYFAPTARFGDPDGFKLFVDAAHQAGLGVILDWVPAHFPKDAHGLVYFDGTHLYEHADPRQGHHPDWKTLIFNYGRPQVAAFLLSSALFWIEEYHLDGLRVDAVASMLYLDYSREDGAWVANKYGGRENLEAIEFLKRLNHEVHTRHPGVLMIAEESTAWPRVTGPVKEDGLGFDYKWNLGWMHDTLEYFRMDPLFRSQNHHKITFGMSYAYSEQYLLSLSHDEVVHGKASLLGKMHGDPEARFANLRLLLGLMYAHPGKKLLFMGTEIGPWQEWNEAASLPWDLLEHAPHARLQQFVTRLNQLHREEPALHQADDRPEGFTWIEADDASRSVYTFVRRDREGGGLVVVIANATPVAWEDYRMPVPEAGTYGSILDSDAVEFGGEGRSADSVSSVKNEDGGDELVFTVAPLSILWLRSAGEK